MEKILVLAYPGSGKTELEKQYENVVDFEHQDFRNQMREKSLYPLLLEQYTMHITVNILKKEQKMLKLFQYVQGLMNLKTISKGLKKEEIVIILLREENQKLLQ